MSESQLTPAERTVDEGASRRYQAVLVDEDQIHRGSDIVQTLTLTLINDRDQSVINGRNAQSVLNAHGVTLDTLGQLTWSIAAADNVIVEPDQVPFFTEEIHVATFVATWSGGAKTAKHVLRLLVRRLKPAES